jgi:hypothetical protein
MNQSKKLSTAARRCNHDDIARGLWIEHNQQKPADQNSKLALRREGRSVSIEGHSTAPGAKVIIEML